MRFGLILSPKGGALSKMLTPFRLGLGGRVGSGKQFWSWVSLRDVVGAIEHALERSDLNGPVNVTAPAPLRNREFTKVLGKVLHRPTVLPLPAFAAKLALGADMAQDLLLASTRVQPQVLLDSQYHFQDTDLEACLRNLLQ